MTSSLPRKCSTTELYRQEMAGISKTNTNYIWSGRRDSNPRPSAWKADALPTELLPQINNCILKYTTQRTSFCGQ
jgi:hypothetical protein